MNKRERILHFAHEGHSGHAAVMKHIDFFRATGSDIVKIQYEHRHPLLDSIRSAQDWTSMPCCDESVYADQLEVVAGVAAELNAEAVIVVLLYSPLMFASHTDGKDALLCHFADDPAKARKAIEQGPRAMILGADCTLAAETDWRNIAAATSVAHTGSR